MKKNMQKYLIGGASVLTLGLLGACGSSNGEANNETGTTKVTWYQVGEEPKDFDEVMTKVNEKLKEEINVELDMRLIPDGDYQQKLGVMINSGEEYDICFVNGTDYVNYGNKGAFISLNDHLDKELKDYAAELNEGFIEGGAINGETYGLPVNNDIATTEYWTFNKDLVDQYQLDVENVEGVETLAPVLEKFAEKNTDTNITPIGMTRTSVCIPYDNIIGGGVPLAVAFEGDTQTVVNTYETPEMMTYLKAMHEFYKKGYILKDAATVTTDPFRIDSKNWFLGRNSSGYQPLAQKNLEALAGHGLILKPAGKAFKTTGFARVAMHAVSASSKHPEAALKLLNYVNTNQEVADLMVYGIEGKHYDRNEDGSITLTNSDDYYQGAWALVNTYLVSKTSPITEESKKLEEESKKFQNEAPMSPILGFSFDASDFRTEIASVQNIVSQYEVLLSSGTVDPEQYVPELLEKLEKAGLDKIQASAQEQYDEWRKSNK
ncbi:extracellular solute-binding protein [Enterococcus gallinarum]|uniref:extracellular solute-binding protein n=1 Tax=Enterococcus gallinarum TaxID=1353 RepID=UPI0012ABACFC|nr:extracellular solute-binding protein [Enterococcus gallinarum]MDT2681239.1 extracellular solute-binding protein [Enterococcus gallinarum]